MILVVDQDPAEYKRIQHRLFRDFCLNTCGSVAEEVENTLLSYPVVAVYIPRTATIPNPIEFCRAFKFAHPNIPLIAGVEKEDPKLDLDILYGVTDNIPLQPLRIVKIAEIICEMIRLYTRKDRLQQTVDGLTLNIYRKAAVFCGLSIPYGVSALCLLRYLAVNHPNPIPLEELTRNIKSPYAPKYNISRIRKLIYDVNFRSRIYINRKLIVNVKEKGYALNAFPETP